MENTAKMAQTFPSGREEEVWKSWILTIYISIKADTVRPFLVPKERACSTGSFSQKLKVKDQLLKFRHG